MRRRLSALALTLVLAAAGVAAGCGDDDGGGGGGGPIKIGGIFDLTGATGDVGTPYADGVKAYVNKLNSDGGIDGRKIDLSWADYAYEIPRAEQLYSRLKSQGVVAIQGWGTGDTEALRGRIATDKLPFMSASYDETLSDPKEAPFNFVVATTYSQQMRIALDWIAKRSGGKANVAVFHNDSPFGESPIEDGKKFIDEKGLGLGYSSYAMPAEATDYVSELERAKGANYIVIQNVSTPAAQLAKDVKRQGSKAQIVCLNWCGDELFAKLAGGAAEGVVAVMPFASTTSGVPGLKAPAAAAGGQAALEKKGVHYVQGWYTMDVMTAGIRKALEDSDSIDGEKIRTALQEMGAVQTGEVTGPIKFSADNHAGMKSSRLFQVKGGEWQPITGFETP
ncbi:MAG: ABC transporter substrate-binding protein [Nocardioidaceae bacterium]